MKNIWSVLILVMLISPLVGQEEANDQTIEISTKSLDKANQKFQKELNRVKRKLNKRLSNLYPDLPSSDIDSLLSLELESKKAELKTQAKDSVTNYLTLLKNDLLTDLKETPQNLPIATDIQESIGLIDELKQKQGLLQNKEELVEMLDVSELKRLNGSVAKLKESFENYKSNFENWEDKLLEQVTSLPQAQLLKKEIDKVKAYEALPEGYRSNLDKFQTNDFVKEKLQKKADELKKVGETTLQDKFDEAQQKVNEAKEKFPSLESVNEAPKRYNPYKGMSFTERVIIGGNLQVNRQQPASVDLALNLTYPLGLKSAIGLSGTTRIFVEKPKGVQTKDKATGLRSFARYEFWKSFFVQGNFEYTQLRPTDVNETDLGEDWVQSALIGLGRKLTLKKNIQMNFTLFYDLLFDEDKSPSNQAWVFRLGFDLDRQKK
ncbi:hypothetical protein [Roseivirga sp.]|uniref:hypothetical protein n=1 Tax=Roseivirga sp. TaxID=1964215 RepID=UPI003B8AAC7F